MHDETKNNVKIIVLLIVVFIILYFAHITLGDRFEDQLGGPHDENETQIIFTTSLTDRTLTVDGIYSNGRTLHWSEVNISEGSANLPYGPINIGDEITNCEGNLKLIWKETGNLIIERDFS